MPSSVIQSYNYDAEREVLKIHFRSGSIYSYQDVPLTEFEAFKTSFSKGQYLNNVIKAKYRFEKLNER